MALMPNKIYSFGTLDLPLFVVKLIILKTLNILYHNVFNNHILQHETDGEIRNNWEDLFLLTCKFMLGTQGYTLFILPGALER